MWIKICGITRTEDALAAAELGANAIGLNFFRGSKRFVPIETAQEIVRKVQGIPIDCVGVFVNSDPIEVLQIAEQAGLNAVQLHGDESVADIAKVQALSPAMKIIRAMRISASGQLDCFHHLRELQNRVDLFAVLLDAFVPGEFGGTGITLDRRLAVEYHAQNLPRLILAGGLTPENVAESIHECRPWGIDTASGVESSPGIKCQEKIGRFIREALRAEASS